MTARELFGVAVRLIGLWASYNFLQTLIWALFRKYNVVRDAALVPTEDHLMEHEVFSLMYLTIAIIFLCGADRVVFLFYGPAPKATPHTAVDSPSTPD